jgi:L-Lysine epsilon oxidase N-terminal/L-lysine epsilon oxidase C-terminal domain/Iron-containing redox enzyme
MGEIAFCKIYPPIGIARVGDSQDDHDGWFVGPELPDQRPHKAEGFKFRDARGRIKRQGARFRIYAYDQDGKPVRELTASEADITWTVGLANKKAAWFQFSGSGLARTAFRGEPSPDLRPRNPTVGKMTHSKSPPHHAPDAERAARLEIDGGMRSIQGAGVHAKSGDATSPLRFKGMFKKVVPVELGELRTDEQGRLIVLGGRGVSDAVDDQGNSIRPARWIRNYANNDDWYDDTSDGPVTAKVVLKKQAKEIPVRGGAWVIVTPPDFAPDVANIVSLYDVLEEVARDNPSLLQPGSPAPRDPKQVYFDDDIAPILQRMHDYRWVNARGLRGHGFRKPGDFQVPGSLGTLSPALAEPTSREGQQLRQRIIGVVRQPAYQRGPSTQDRYSDPGAVAQATGVFMPPLAGDEGDPVPGDASTWLSLTYLQYERLRAWADGKFSPGKDPAAEVKPDAPDATRLSRELELLTRGALEACAGGAFYPGIEMTVIAREPALYSEAFRISHDLLKPGDITKYMAVPWQADFWECRDHWWPAQRPDDVVTEQEFELLLKQFTEETTGSYRQRFEQVLFNRVRWDRGIGPSQRPSLELLLSRLLPDPGPAKVTDYIATVRDILLRFFVALTPISSYESWATDEWPASERGDRLPSPWRLQYLTQEALDGYSGLYFHLVVPAPEEVFARTKELGNKPFDLTELRRSWSTKRLTEPATAARVLGIYAGAIRNALRDQIRLILGEHPDAERSAAELRDSLSSSSVAGLEQDNPQEFSTKDPIYKTLRATEMIEQALDRLYVFFTNWSGDMEMIDKWRDLGFVVERDVTIPDGDDSVTVHAQIEVERPKYDGKSFRDYFYYLMNIEEYQDFIPQAKRVAVRILDAAQKLIDETGIFDPSHPESPIEYSRESFAAKLDEIYELLRSQAATALGWRTSRTRDELMRRILDTAPFNQTDGAWLRYIANAGPTDKVRSLLFEVWSDEIGNGDPALHHGNLFTVLLSSLGMHLPPIASRAYVDNLDLDESTFIGAVFQLCISLHSEAFFPELLGMTLFLEWEVLSLVAGVKGREYLGIDPHFWKMHVGIDNATNGHGAKARAAVELYMDHVFKEGGADAMQAEWRRIWRGFVAFATAGYDFAANLDGQDDLTLGRRHPGSPEDRLGELITRKARYGSLNHLDNRLGPHRINDLFERPDIFIEELAHSPWIVPGVPDESRLLTHLTSFEGPMFKVFDERDLDLFREWILWLGSEGDTRAPKRYLEKGEAMLILLSELRELAQASSGHRRYRLALSGGAGGAGGAAPPAPGTRTIAELFEQGDLKVLMRALANPDNGWVVPFDPGASALILDQARANRPMGIALDRRFASLGNQIGRLVVIRWIEAGCPIPGEPPPPREVVPLQKPWDGNVLFVQKYGMGAVH